MAPMLSWRCARGLDRLFAEYGFFHELEKVNPAFGESAEQTEIEQRVNNGPDKRLIKVMVLNLLLMRSRIFKRISRNSRLMGYAAERKSFIWSLNANGSSSTLFAPAHI